MKTTLLRIRGVEAALGTTLLVLVLAFGIINAGDRDYKVEGTYIEGFNCKDAPPYVMMNSQADGCQGIGVLLLTGGKYMNVDLKNAKIAYATQSGDWVRIYVDAENAVQREAAIAFAKDYLTPVGRIDTAREAKIAVTGKDGDYTVMVDNGNVIQLTTKPVLGGDKEHPVSYNNSRSKLSKTLYQAQTLHGSFADGNRRFELKDANAYFNNDLNTKGSL